MSKKNSKREQEDAFVDLGVAQMEAIGPENCTTGIELDDGKIRVVFDKTKKIKMVDAQNIAVDTLPRLIDKSGTFGIVIFPGARVRVGVRGGSIDDLIRSDDNVSYELGIELQNGEQLYQDTLQIVNRSNTRVVLKEGDVVARKV